MYKSGDVRARITAILVVLLGFSAFGIAQADCRVDDMQIGQDRDSVLSELKARGCKFVLNVPEDGIETDGIFPPGVTAHSKFASHELVFAKGKLKVARSYTPVYVSADNVVYVMSRMLAEYGIADPSGAGVRTDGSSRVTVASTFLQRPRSGKGVVKLGFDAKNGTIVLEESRGKTGTAGVRIVMVRTR